MNELYKYLNTQFTDLPSAKKWYRIWRDDWDQEIPDWPEDSYTCRVMAGHISDVLEGKEDYNNGISLTYMDTRYGSDIFLGD